MNTSHEYDFFANQETYADIHLKGLERERISISSADDLVNLEITLDIYLCM